MANKCEKIFNLSAISGKSNVKQQYSLIRLTTILNCEDIKNGRMWENTDVNKLQVGQKLVKPLWKPDWQHLLKLKCSFTLTAPMTSTSCNSCPYIILLECGLDLVIHFLINTIWWKCWISLLRSALKKCSKFLREKKNDMGQKLVFAF